MVTEWVDKVRHWDRGLRGKVNQSMEKLPPSTSMYRALLDAHRKIVSRTYKQRNKVRY
jgi:hypothetical protein